MMISLRILLPLVLMGLVACGGSTSDQQPEPDPLPLPEPDPDPPVDCVPGQTASATYTLAWDPLDAADLSGYQIYFGLESPLTKTNALGNIPVEAGLTSLIFSPADHDLTTCTEVYLAVSALGSRPESALSTMLSLQVE